MTRKDYIKIAAALAVNKPNDVAHHPAAGSQWRMDVNAITDVLQADNPRFNRRRFLVAAGALEAEQKG